LLQDLRAPSCLSAGVIALAALEAQSTDQLAVVTLKSLQGYAIEEYGYQLGRAGEIGQAGKNNGVLLLVAPNERKVRIEVGYGLESDLTDSESGQIIRQYANPNFKVNNWSAGTEATINGIIDYLGPKPFQARVEARAEEKKMREEEQTRMNAEFVATLKYAFPVVLILLFLFGPAVVFLYRKHRRNELKDLINNSIDADRESIATIRVKYLPAMARLEQLAKEITPDEYRVANDKLTALPQVVSGIESNLNILAIIQENSLSALEEQLYALRNVLSSLARISPDTVINSIESKIRERKEAERKSKELLESVPKKVAIVREKTIVDERQITRAEGKLSEAENQSKTVSPNWIAIYALLVTADNLLNQPRYSPSNYGSHNSHGNHRSNYPSSHQGSRSTGGSSFGGFGGGRSGGGGATGSF